MFPLDFVVKRHVEKYGNVPGFQLVELCGTKQRNHPRGEYIEALKKIAALDSNLNPDGPGVDIQVPFQECFRTGFKGGTIGEFKDIVAAEKQIREEWDTYERKNKQREVEPGSLRCTLMLKPMIAEFDEMKISSAMVDTMDRAIANNVLFSRFSLNLHFNENLMAKQRTYKKKFGQLLTAVFNSSRRSLGTYNTKYCLPSEDCNPLQLGRVRLECCDHEVPLAQFKSMCSALAVNYMTKDLSIALEIEPDNDRESGHWWRWLTYGLFSRRARKHSILEHLVLDCVGHMGVEDVDNFTAVMTSSHPEELLIGSPRGLINERDGTLKSRAPIRWQFDEQGQHSVDSGPLVIDSPMLLVRTFSDDGESEWVNAIIPGCGRCQDRRKDLTFSCDKSEDIVPLGITSLKIRFTMESEVADGLPNLLATVGASLKRLTLQGRRELLGDDLFLESCPNLLDLRLSGSVVEARIDFRDYRSSHDDFKLPTVSCNWQNVSTLAQELMNTDSLLAKCLRQVRIRLASKWLPGSVPYGYDTTRYEADLNALLQMLEVNRSLEYVDVIVPTMFASYASKFARLNLQPIDRPFQLPIEVKIAFLSVVGLGKTVEVGRKRNHKISPSLSPICKLDRLMLSNIFAFAVPPILRQMFFHSEQEFVFGGFMEEAELSDGDY